MKVHLPPNFGLTTPNCYPLFTNLEKITNAQIKNIPFFTFITIDE